MRSRTSQSLIFSFLVAAVAVVCTNAWLALRVVGDLAESQRSVSHSWRVIDLLEQVSNLLADAETGAQEYLFSGDSAYLAPYTHAKAELPEDLATIEGLVQDNPSEEEALRNLRAVTLSRISLLEQQLKERQANNPNSVSMQVLGGTGLAEMNHARALIAQMNDTEQRLRAQRIERWHRGARRARATVIFASAVDLFLLLAMFRYIVVERRLLRRSAETTDRLEKLQRISDLALTHLTVAELTAELLARVKKVISADVVLLCLRSGQDAFAIEAASGIAIPSGTILSGAEGSPLDHAVKTGHAVMEPDTSSTPLSVEALRRTTRSLLVAPLSSANSVAGALVAGRQVAISFGVHDEEILSLVAHRLAMALDRDNAYESERRARREAELKAAEIHMLNEKLEERVRERTSELETTNRELEAFSYSVSHDLRAPLRTIDGFSLAFEEDYGQSVDERARDYLRRTREGVQRMGHLIDSLLQLSRITRAELARERVDLSVMARAVADDLTAQNPDRRLLFQIEPGLYSMGDSRLLRAAFENLLGNAVKFTAREPEARIDLGYSNGAYYIRDNGVGFDMRYADKLFNAFNRLHGDREFRGSGIGLATVARIVRRHHGKIWAESELGKGATFWFTLG